MQFKTEAQKRTCEKVRDYLCALFGEVNVQETDDSFVLEEGSTFVYVRAFAVGEERSGVEIFSYVVTDVTITSPLLRFLLEHNLKLIFGGFGLSVDPDGKGTIVLTHTILGEGIGRDELYACVSAVARVADKVDDQIVRAFGGKTARDKLMAMRTPPEIWE